MKRIGLCAFTVLFFVTVITSCLSFSVFAYETVPSISVAPSGGYYANVNDSPNGLVSIQTFAGNSIARIRISNVNNLLNQYLMYQFIITPQLAGGNSPKDWDNLHIVTGNHSVSAVGAENVSIRTQIIDYGDLTDDGIAYNSSLLCTISFIINNASASYVTLTFSNPTVWIYYDGNTGATLNTYCTYVGSFVSYSQGFNNVINQVGHFENSFISHMPSVSGYTWDSISFNGNGGAEVTTQTGSWWDAMLNSVKNLQLDISKSASFQAIIDYASTDENDDSALTYALEKINSNNAIGIFSSFDVDELAPNNPGELASLIGESITDWFTSENKQNIDNVSRSRVDNEIWITPYSDNLQNLLDLIEEGGNEDGTDSTD